MRDAASLVLPPTAEGVPPADHAEDLHVVKYATAGAYGYLYVRYSDVTSTRCM